MEKQWIVHQDQIIIDLTSAISLEEPQGSILEYFSPKPKAEMPGRLYVIGCK